MLTPHFIENGCPFIRGCRLPRNSGQGNLFISGEIIRSGGLGWVSETIAESDGFLLKNVGLTWINEAISPNVQSNKKTGEIIWIGEAIGEQLIQPFDTDKTETYSFTDLTEITISHSLNKNPDVSVIDENGNEIYVSVDYLSISQIYLCWNGLASGQIFLN